MGKPAHYLSSLMTVSHNILTTRRSRRFLLVFLILSVGCFLMITLNHSQGLLDLGSYGGYYGLDNNWKPITAESNKWRGNTVAKEVDVPEATWTCTDDGLSDEEKDTEYNRRSRQCVVENLCVDRQGAFIRSNGLWSRKNLPKVNLMSSDNESDLFWQPRLERSWRKAIQAHYVNDTVFVHGLYSPFHFSHWLYNGMMPLYSTMKRFGGTKDSWTFRAGRFKYDPIDRQGAWEMGHFFQTGKELVLSQAELSTPFQSLPPGDAPICFRRAVIGLGSQCALSYCANNIPTEIYKSFREELSEFYWKTPQTWQMHLENAQKAIDRGLEHQEHGHSTRQVDDEEKEELNEKESQKNEQRLDVTGAKKADSQLRCLELARYYNFEGAGPNHGLEHEELQNRVGQMNPDVVDAERDYENLFVENGATGGEPTHESKRKLVVGIIQREQSRRLINDESLIQGLVKAGFRVKWMSFDHGCGLAETAYLLRDVNVLISPHGNALGTSIFMPSHGAVPTIISVDNSRYWEGWFMFTATAMGQRFIQTVCGPHNYVDEAAKEQCPYFKDLDGALDLMGGVSLILGVPDSMIKTDKEKSKMSGGAQSKLRDQYRDYVKDHPEAQKLAEEELDVMIGAEPPNALIEKYGEDAWSFLGHFWKGVPRYVDVGRLLKFVEGLQRDLEQEKVVETSVQLNPNMGVSQKSYGLYVEYVRKGQACGFSQCEEMLERNVAGEKTSAFGKHSIDDIPKWGQPTSESQTLREGLTPEILKMAWKIEG